jgi:HlyD family secretion protein
VKGESPEMKKGKIIVILLVLAILVGAGIFFVKKFLKKDNTEDGRLVYVESVASITGHGTGISNRYMGVVEAQETKKVDKDDSKKISEIFVNVGDSVKEGDQLFAYDTE